MTSSQQTVWLAALILSAAIAAAALAGMSDRPATSQTVEDVPAKGCIPATMFFELALSPEQAGQFIWIISTTTDGQVCVHKVERRVP